MSVADITVLFATQQLYTVGSLINAAQLSYSSQQPRNSC